MATKYAVNAGGNWNDTNTWSSVAAKDASRVGGAGVPAAGDDVVLDDYSGSVAVNADTAEIKSFVMTGYTSTLSGSSRITVRGSSGGSDSVIFNGTITWTGALFLKGAWADAVISVTFNGKTINNISSVGSSTAAYYFLDALTLSGTLTFSSGALHVDGPTDDSGLSHSWGKFSGTGTTARSLYLGNASITITGTGTGVWDITTTTNLTFDSVGSTITFTGSAPNMKPGGGLAYNHVHFNGCTTPFLNWFSASTTWNELKITGPASKTGVFYFDSTLTINDAFVLNGNSAINRLLVYGTTYGTQVTVALGASATCLTGSSGYVDIRDINMTGGASGERNLSTISSGDCGGNAGITFTTAVDQHWLNVDGGNWSTASNWTSRIPLPQDDVYLDLAFNSGKTVTCDMPRAVNHWIAAERVHRVRCPS
jgi:hypothetical protein